MRAALDETRQGETCRRVVRIAFDGVTLAFGRLVVFDGLTVEFSSGRSTAIVGSNGAGKSTLLKLAGQFTEPDAGSVKAFDGATELLRADFRKRLAMVSPTMSLYARLTGEENLKFFAGLRGVGIDDVGGLFERVGLASGDGKKFVGEYSTGMAQRLKLAILLSTGADVWLLDEPGANLDEAGRSMVLSEIERAAGEGKLILLATNDPIEASAADERLSLTR
ncbi:MAG: ABC transporter ATP-binding protein [Selenomonadaceae bacterium]|nr:ABC transporter ATP-binding protein [Selenomonadaceae bacterium]